ncbi:hypothetical protein Acr_11g0006660 [Actinidia rufa]|uniref:PROP1-like PPR domain-containing protein n=1 Tax=Actinidia rufa TaxID=165716 RepID=A0A7J0FCD4_9ERIC|nr:hypothetical protein Acr_11g0006660 [Actinidia rufa]
MMETIGSLVANEEEKKRSKKGADTKLGKGKREKKIKVDSEETSLKVGLDMCSKNGGVIGAIKLYDWVKRKGIKMGQYHYTVLLYLCSSAATGVVRPTKSGSGGRVESINQDGVKLDSNEFPNPQVKGRTIQLRSGDYDSKNIKNGNNPENYGIQVSEDFKIMALAMGDGDMAFDTVKQMKALGINPRLRSYVPALSAFCNCRDVDKAFAVEEHMSQRASVVSIQKSPNWRWS